MSDFTRKWTDTIRKMPMRGSAMSDENVGGLVELLPCPFCGGAPELKWHGSGVPGMEDCGYVGIDCCIAHAHADDDESAISQWNSRALSAHGQPVVDEAMVKRAVDATAPPDRTRLDHEEYAEAILTAALGATP